MLSHIAQVHDILGGPVYAVDKAPVQDQIGQKSQKGTQKKKHRIIQAKSPKADVSF
jgi:hypothetical protein